MMIERFSEELSVYLGKGFRARKPSFGFPLG
jgi:hypothetical protein